MLTGTGGACSVNQPIAGRGVRRSLLAHMRIVASDDPMQSRMTVQLPMAAMRVLLSQQEAKMTKTFLMAFLILAMLPQWSFARGGGHRSGSALGAPANPSVPPSLTPDPRLAGTAPLPRETQPVRGSNPDARSAVVVTSPDDARIDRILKNICHGC